jgi:hypothetical protein
VRVSQSGDYHVYVWFPSSEAHARRARYTVEDDRGAHTFIVNQTEGGRWVRLREYPFDFSRGQTYEIYVSNYSPEDVGQRAADDS